MAGKARNSCLDRWVEGVMSLETRLTRHNFRSKCAEVTLQQALRRLQETRAPPIQPAAPSRSRKPMPRGLAPLHIKFPSASRENGTTSRRSTSKQETSLPRSVPHTNLVSHDHHQVLSLQIKSKESSSSSLSCEFRSPLTLSRGWKPSAPSSSYDHSLPSSLQSNAFRTPFTKAPPPIVRKRVPSLPCLQRLPSPTKTNHIPYLMRTTQIRPQPRPPNPLGSKSTNPRRRRRQRSEQDSESLGGTQLEHMERDTLQLNHADQHTCSSTGPRLAQTCAVRVNAPEESLNDAFSVGKSNRLRPDPANMVIPVITIRTATPNCPPGLVIPAITIRTATPLPEDPLDPPTTDLIEESENPRT